MGEDVGETFSADTDGLRERAPQFDVIGAEVAETVRTLRAALSSAGEPWGKDDAGRAFAETYVPEHKRAMSDLESLVEVLQQAGPDLRNLAESFDSQDRAVAQRVNNAAVPIRHDYTSVRRTVRRPSAGTIPRRILPPHSPPRNRLRRPPPLRRSAPGPARRPPRHLVHRILPTALPIRRRTHRHQDSKRTAVRAPSPGRTTRGPSGRIHPGRAGTPRYRRLGHPLGRRRRIGRRPRGPSRPSPRSPPPPPGSAPRRRRAAGRPAHRGRGPPPAGRGYPLRMPVHPVRRHAGRDALPGGRNARRRE